MVDPLVSVVIPVYKVEKYLVRCLDSVIAQDYRPIEVILVNDGSPDGCGEIIRRYQNSFPFIRSICQDNQGVGAARNNGIASATGKYLVLVDSDDYVEKDYISGLVSLAEEQKADVVVCNFYFEIPNGLKIAFPFLTLHKNLSGESAARLSINLLKLPSFVWNKLYRRELFHEHAIVFPPICYEDVATIPRLLINVKRVAVTRKPYYHYCLRSNSLTGNFGVRNVADYLRAAEIIRHFIWEKQLWGAWKRPYRNFLRMVETQLLVEVFLRRNSIKAKSRFQLGRQIHDRMRELDRVPEEEQPDPNTAAMLLAEGKR